MNSIKKSLSLKLLVASTIAVSSLTYAPPASAQLFELAAGALSIFNNLTKKSGPQQTPQQAPPVVIPQRQLPPSSPKYTVGAGNLNGNTINLCISGCMPSGTQAVPPRPQSFPTFPPARVTQSPTPIPQQAVPSKPGIVNTVPPGATTQPRTTTAPPQPAPNRPVLTIPPIPLPVNIPN